jgi:hypothetical protein
VVVIGNVVVNSVVGEIEPIEEKKDYSCTNCTIARRIVLSSWEEAKKGSMLAE